MQGYGTVRYQTAEAAQAAIQDVHGTDLEARPLPALGDDVKELSGNKFDGGCMPLVLPCHLVTSHALPLEVCRLSWCKLAVRRDVCSLSGSTSSPEQ